MAAAQGATTCVAYTSETAMRTVPTSTSCASANSCVARSVASFIGTTASCNAWARCVGLSLPGSRTNSASPSVPSSSRTWRPTLGCVVAKRRAASVSVPDS
jgi:hypothetical protein